MERGERLRIEALSSGELKRKMKNPFLVRDTIQGLDRDQSFVLASTHSRDGRLPANLPMTAYEKDSLLELIMEMGIVKRWFTINAGHGGEGEGCVAERRRSISERLGIGEGRGD